MSGSDLELPVRLLPGSRLTGDRILRCTRPGGSRLEALIRSLSRPYHGSSPPAGARYPSSVRGLWTSASPSGLRLTLLPPALLRDNLQRVVADRLREIRAHAHRYSP